MVWFKLLVDLVLMVSQVNAGAVILLDHSLSCDSFPWTFNFTFSYNSSYEFDPPFESYRSPYGYRVICYDPSTRACGNIENARKSGLTVGSINDTKGPIEIYIAKKDFINVTCPYNADDTPYCSLEFNVNSERVPVLPDPVFYSVPEITTPTDPQSPTDTVLVLSVSLSIVFLFGIGLTALLVILILKCRRNFKLRANAICHLSLNYLDDFIKDVDPEKATIFNETDYCNGDSNSEFHENKDSSTVKGDKTNVFDEEMSTEITLNEVKSLETNSSHVDTPSALNLTNIDIRKTKIDSTSSEADSGVVLGYVPIGSLQEKSDCLPK